MKKLKRSATNKKIMGVCGGLGEYLNLDATLVRLLACLLGLCSCGTAIIIYLIAGIIMPEE